MYLSADRRGKTTVTQTAGIMPVLERRTACAFLVTYEMLADGM